MHKIILVGKAASGKDHMRKVLTARGFTYAVSYTTRPARENERDGHDYVFITEDEFKQRISENFWYEWVEFNGWFYGTSKAQFHESCDLFIMTPSGVSHIKAEDRLDCLIIYLDISLDVRKARLMSRNMPGDSANRRINADESDFMNFTDYDIVIKNNDF